MPNSLYAQYITERTNDKIIELPQGFATYRYFPHTKSCYIVDIYVQPEFRKSGIASEMANMIAAEAKKDGYTSLIGTVSPSANHSTDSMRVLMAYGMKLDSSERDVIVFKKDIV